MILEGIKAYLEAIPPDRPGNRITGSALGKCDRQLAYKYHGFKGEPGNWKNWLVFNDGDLAHDQLRAIMVKAVPHTGWELIDVEREVQLETPQGYTIKGHIDGVLRNLDDDRRMLLEIKSMSSYAFDEDDIEASYQAQMSGYMSALGLEDALFVSKNKDTADLHERIYHIDKELVARRLEAIDKIVSSKAPNMVERSYGADKRGRLDWHCAYCPHWQPCWEGRASQHQGPRGGKFLMLEA